MRIVFIYLCDIVSLISLVTSKAINQLNVKMRCWICIYQEIHLFCIFKHNSTSQICTSGKDIIRKLLTAVKNNQIKTKTSKYIIHQLLCYLLMCYFCVKRPLNKVRLRQPHCEVGDSMQKTRLVRITMVTDKQTYRIKHLGLALQLTIIISCDFAAVCLSVCLYLAVVCVCVCGRARARLCICVYMYLRVQQLIIQ